MGNGNLGKEVYVGEQALAYSTEIVARIENGEYPIILAKEGKFDLHFISESELSDYTHYDALDEDVVAQHEKFGANIPVVYDGFDTGGIPHKVLEAPTE